MRFSVSIETEKRTQPRGATAHLPCDRQAGDAPAVPTTLPRGCHRRTGRFAARLVDPVTHILLGASLGYAAFHRRLGRTAALAGGLAAFAPDADVFIRSAADPLLAIEHHRGFTHALVFAPIGAAIVAALWLFCPAWRFRTESNRASMGAATTKRIVAAPIKARWLPLWLCCTLAYLSHALLDAATSYGTQLLWPFSMHRAGWDVIAIIDPVFTFTLLIALVVALGRQRPKAADIGLALAALYIGFGTIQHNRARSTLRELATARGHRPERMELMPTLANNLVWRALYLHRGQIHSDRVRVGWFSAPTVRPGWSLSLVQPSDLTSPEVARNRNRSFERFAWFSDHWVARSPADPTLLADMRYTLSAEAFDPIWGIRFTPPSAPTEVTWVNRSRARRVGPGEMWAEIIGRDSRFGSIVVRDMSDRSGQP